MTTSRRWLIGLSAVGVLACGEDSGNGDSTIATVPIARPGLSFESYGLRPEDILRVRKDVARDRVWVLSLDGARVYSLEDKRLIRRIALPPWSVPADICMPDMAVDQSGSVFISSNAHPTIWSIDAITFELKEYEIRLLGRQGWSIGFGALAFDADGTLIGMTASANSLWKIDVESAIAREIEFYNPPKESCAVRALARFTASGTD